MAQKKEGGVTEIARSHKRTKPKPSNLLLSVADGGAEMRTLLKNKTGPTN